MKKEIYLKMKTPSSAFHISITIFLTIIANSLTLEPGRYLFSPENHKDKIMSLKLNRMQNAGTRFDGNIHIYDEKNKFYSSGVKIYFNKTFDRNTELQKVLNQETNEEVYTVTVSSDYFQKFRFDGVGGRESKEKDRPITFTMSKNATGEVNFIEFIRSISFEGKIYIMPQKNLMESITYRASHTFFILSCVITFLIVFPQGGGKKKGGGSHDSIFLMSFFYGKAYIYFCIPMALLMIRTMIQFIYLAFLWPSHIWFIAFAFMSICIKKPESENLVVCVFGLWILGGIFFIISFFQIDLAFYLFFVGFQIAWMIDFITGMDGKSSRPMIGQFILYILFNFGIMFGSIFYTFFHRKTNKGYPVNTALSMIFWITMIVSVILNTTFAFFCGGGKILNGLCSSIISCIESLKKKEKPVEKNIFQASVPENDVVLKQKSFEIRSMELLPKPNDENNKRNDIQIDTGLNLNKKHEEEVNKNNEKDIPDERPNKTPFDEEENNKTKTWAKDLGEPKEMKVRPKIEIKEENSIIEEKNNDNIHREGFEEINFGGHNDIRIE